jgi:hypothetical protein
MQNKQWIKKISLEKQHGKEAMSLMRNPDLTAPKRNITVFGHMLSLLGLLKQAIFIVPKTVLSNAHSITE